MTVEDAGKYKVTAKNELGESNATISLNFDSKCLEFATTINPLKLRPMIRFAHELSIRLLNCFFINIRSVRLLILYLCWYNIQHTLS